MMLLASLMILTTIGGSFCHENNDEESCFERERIKCMGTTPPYSGYPQTPEDLIAICRTFISVQRCLLEAMENCPDEPDYFGDRPINLDYLESTCQADNPTFKVIASNLPCVERVLKSQNWRHCRHFFSEKNLEDIMTQLRLLAGDDYESERARCLNDLLDVTCQGVIFGYHCGEEMEEAVEEIIVHVRSPDYMKCSAEQLEEMSPFLKMFEGLLIEEIELGNNLKKKRK